MLTPNHTLAIESVQKSKLLSLYILGTLFMLMDEQASRVSIFKTLKKSEESKDDVL